VNNQESFNNCTRWIKEAERYSNQRGVGKIIVATKCDSDLKIRAVSHANAQSFAEQNEMAYIETSSKDDLNVTEAFVKLVEVIQEEMEREI